MYRTDTSIRYREAAPCPPRSCTTPWSHLQRDPANRAGIAAQVWAALGDARTVLNVGAGTGSYEPPVVTSPRWNPQRSCARSAPQAPRRAWLPLRRAFRSTTSPSTPRWPSPPSTTGRTRSRVCARCGASPGRVVVFTKDFTDPDLFWLNRDYLPEFADLLIGRPSLTDRPADRGPRGTGAHSVGCADGFYEAYWRRSAAYLDVRVRRGMSIWARVGREPSSGQCAASVMTLHPAGGPNATATSSISTRPSLASACLSPEPRLATEGRSWARPHRVGGHAPIGQTVRFKPSLQRVLGQVCPYTIASNVSAETRWRVCPGPGPVARRGRGRSKHEYRPALNVKTSWSR